MKFWALVGLGPNSVEITSLVFSSLEKALETLIPLLGPLAVADRHYWRVPELNNDYDEEADRDTDKQVWFKRFYTHYYGGCGECYAFELREVIEGQPFNAFDLD